MNLSYILWAHICSLLLLNNYSYATPRNMLLIPEFSGSVPAVKTSCPFLSPPFGVPGVLHLRKAKGNAGDASFPFYFLQVLWWEMEDRGEAGHRLSLFSLTDGQNETSCMTFSIKQTKGFPYNNSCSNYCFSLSKTAKFSLTTSSDEESTSTPTKLFQQLISALLKQLALFPRQVI